LHGEIAIVGICRVARENVRRTRIRDDRSIDLGTIGCRNDDIATQHVVARVGALVKYGVGAVEQCA
jgi:hypothetical protein